MSSRPASPPPINPWPFYAGTFALAAFAIHLLLFAGRPPAVVPIVLAMASLGGGIILWLIPEILSNERRLRMAEAAVRDATDAQLRRLAQTADQLTHVVSRSQSTEEQAGRALGTLEEVAEKMVAQAEELASALTRSGEREQSTHAEELQRLTDERDQKLTALEIRLNATSVALTETQAAIKKSSVTTSRAIETLATRLESIAGELREAILARPAPVAPPSPVPAVPENEPAPAPEKQSARIVESSQPAIAPPAADPEVIEVVAPAAAEAAAAVDSTEVADTPAPAETPVVIADEPPPAPRPARKPRIHREVEKPSEPPVKISPSDTTAPVADGAVVEKQEPAPSSPTSPLELALEGLPEPRPIMRLNRREPAGSTSLVATAYIGIGNKLFLRGEGPGLSWERGVPMQFLAIGKWGWTTTEAAAPVTCRVYRNDDTPMLEENIVIDPGAKSEVTPKF